MTKLASKQLAAAALLIATYVTALVTAKKYLYAGWTWRGFITDYKAILALAAFVGVPIGSLWHVYRNRTPGHSLVSSLRRILLGKRLDLFLVSLASAVFILLLLLAGRNSTPFPELDAHIEQHNWSYAEAVLEKKRSEPVRQDLLFSYEHYIDAHSRSDGNAFENGQFHREQRAAVLREIDLGRGVKTLNILTFAELSKIIYFVEDRDPSELESALAMLDENIKSSDDDAVSLYRQKVADLYLAQKKYRKARREYSKVISKSNVQAAVLDANIGNILVTMGKVDSAIVLYERAEEYYPEGRRDIFYSNFGYLLMVGNRHADAERAVRNALANNPEDWYSYLNLGLIYDSMGRFEDAMLNYDVVLRNDPHRDFVKEARLLKAYSLLRAGRNEAAAIGEILTALGRSPAQAPRIAADTTEKRLLFSAAARALENVNTHGIERYIDFFDGLATGADAHTSAY